MRLTFSPICHSCWWAWAGQAGAGDLRPYALVQFLPLILLAYRSRWTRSGSLWLVGGWYLLAKLFEFTDRPVFVLTGLSGHTFKHLAAAVAA